MRCVGVHGVVFPHAVVRRHAVCLVFWTCFSIIHDRTILQSLTLPHHFPNFRPFAINLTLYLASHLNLYLVRFRKKRNTCLTPKPSCQPCLSASYFDSQELEQERLLLAKAKTPWWVLSPNSPKRICWDLTGVPRFLARSARLASFRSGRSGTSLFGVRGGLGRSLVWGRGTSLRWAVSLYSELVGWRGEGLVDMVDWIPDIHI